jgi:hypothetical protein
MWTSLEIAKFVASLAVPAIVALIGIWLKYKIDESQKTEERRFQEIKQELYRDDKPRVELTLDCAFHGVQGDRRLVVFTVSAKNVGKVRHKIDRVKLRVRAIDDEPFSYRQEDEDYLLEDHVWPGLSRRRERRQPRLDFPHKVLETDLVPAEWHFIFVEPGVTQSLSYARPIPVRHRYLLVHAIFTYEEFSNPHSAEVVFALPRDVSG